MGRNRSLFVSNEINLTGHPLQNPMIIANMRCIPPKAVAITETS